MGYYLSARNMGYLVGLNLNQIQINLALDSFILFVSDRNPHASID